MPRHFMKCQISADAYGIDNPRTIKELKDTNVSELSYLLSQMSGKAIADPTSIRMPEVTWREGAPMVSFTVNAADG